MIVAAWSDAIDFTIPNRLVIGLLVLYPAYVMTAAHATDWPMALAVATGILALGLILYGTGKMGAGDVKLIAVIGSAWLIIAKRCRLTIGDRQFDNRDSLFDLINRHLGSYSSGLRPLQPLLSI